MFMKAGSDINITCIITGASNPSHVTWFHITPASRKEKVEEVNAGGRGGVQLVTDKRSGHSWLLVTSATWKDAGNYTCAPARATPASVTVHVLDEGAPAAMQKDLPSSAPSSSSAVAPVPLGSDTNYISSFVTSRFNSKITKSLLNSDDIWQQNKCQMSSDNSFLFVILDVRKSICYFFSFITLSILPFSCVKFICKVFPP
ncbi:UNVERIFIED_CONTAM: hypothetical protein RMT77_019135 [Armadillidium vulgare]